MARSPAKNSVHAVVNLFRIRGYPAANSVKNVKKSKESKNSNKSTKPVRFHRPFYRGFPAYYRRRRERPPSKSFSKSTVQVKYVKDPDTEHRYAECLAQNRQVIRENIKLKTEVFTYRSFLNESYKNDIKFFEMQSKFRRMQALGSEFIRDIAQHHPSIEVPEELVDLLRDDDNDTSPVSVTSPVPVGKRFVLPVVFRTIEKGCRLESIPLTPIDEEYGTRANATIVRGVSQAAKQDRLRQRRTALPNELQADGVLSQVSLDCTPGETNSAAVEIISADTVDKDKPPVALDDFDNLENIPVPSTKAGVSRASLVPEGSASSAKNKRTLTAAALEPVAVVRRQSVINSPRPAGFARRSLSFASSSSDIHDNELARPKKLCFNNCNMEKDHSDEENTESHNEIEEDPFGDVIPLAKPKARTRSTQSSRDFWDSFDSNTSINSTSDSSVLESNDERYSFRLRRASSKMVSYKEPSLNTKMRRPSNVPPLTPSQDKPRHRSSKSLRKHSLELEEKSRNGHVTMLK